ncbi:MAG: hypothetical protein ACK44S_07630 [Bacteroidota bacterium]|jgi:hypothetical protein
MQQKPSYLFVVLLSILMVSCDQETKKANGAPIVMGDPATIVNESDTVFLRDNVAAMTIAQAAPEVDTPVAAPVAAAPKAASAPAPIAKAPAVKPVSKKQVHHKARRHQAVARKKTVAKKAVKKAAPKKASKRRRR